MRGNKSHPDRAYLLRCWREGETAGGKEPIWRFSLEEVLRERRQKGFSSLRELIGFLQAELGGAQENAMGDDIPQNWGNRRRQDRRG